MSDARPVRFFDTTLRDGEQSPGVSLSPEEKLEIARQLARLKVDVIEAGFPITSPGEFRAVQAIAREVRGPVICALARTDPRDVDRAWEAIREAERARIHVFISTSPIHLRHMLRMSEAEVLKLAVAMVARARQYTADVQFSAQDATRSDPAFLVEIFHAAIEAGATTINVPDTVGYTTPPEYVRLIRALRERIPGVERAVVSTHTHDDLGLAVANALAAVEAGADQVECAVNGIGERAGNCALEEVCMALVTRKDHFGRQVGIQTDQLYRTSRLVARLTGMPVPANKAVVGANAFAHESGIHQDGVLKERTTYEIMTPEAVGIPASRLVLGKHSGRHALGARLEAMGYTVSGEEFRRVFARFKDLADRKKEISDADIEAIVHDEVLAGPEEVVRLAYFHVTSGSQTVPSATVRLEGPHGASQESAIGDGPVDAVYRAVDKAVGVHHRLVDYTLQAVTGGKDAQGEVTVRIEDTDGRIYLGRGVSTDVIEASARAYVAAVNKALVQACGNGRGAAAGKAAAAKAGAGPAAEAGGT